jgi:hypothetical protein
VKIDWVRNEIARMRAKADGLCKERADLRRLSNASVVGGNDP